MPPVVCPFRQSLLNVVNLTTEASHEDSLIKNKNVEFVGNGSAMNTQGYNKILNLDEKVSQAKTFLKEFCIDNHRSVDNFHHVLRIVSKSKNLLEVEESSRSRRIVSKSKNLLKVEESSRSRRIVSILMLSVSVLTSYLFAYLGLRM